MQRWLDRTVKPLLVREHENILIQADASLDATEQLKQAEQPHLSCPPLAFLSIDLATVPGLNEAVRAPIDPNVLDGGKFAINAMESEIVPRQLVAGVGDLALPRELIADVLDPL